MFKGTMTKIADAALSLQYLLVKFGTDAGHFAVAGAADRPVGTCLDIPAAGESAAIGLLGCADETRTMVAAGIIAAGDQVFAAAGGKIAATGTVCVGTALQAAAAANDEIQVDSCVPFTVPEPTTTPTE